MVWALVFFLGVASAAGAGRLSDGAADGRSQPGSHGPPRSDAGGWGVFALLPAAALGSALGMYTLVVRPLRRRLDDLRRRGEERSESLQQALERESRAGLAKSEFICNASHELRTPLQAIIGYAGLAEQAAVEGRIEQVFEALEVVDRNAGRLRTLIDEVADLATLEAGRSALHHESVRVADMAEELTTAVRPLLGATVRLSVEIGPAVPESLRLDRARLRQVLLNLLNNAAKRTRGGRIRLTVLAAKNVPSSDGAEDEDRPHWEFAVSDTGAPIPVVELERMFCPQGRAEDLGLTPAATPRPGLTISRRLTLLMGGTLFAQSGFDGSNRFSVRLPAAVGDDPTGSSSAPRGKSSPGASPPPSGTPALTYTAPAASAAGGPLSGVNVLLVEDSPDNSRLLAHHLRRAGAAVAHAEDGREAVDRLMPESALRRPRQPDVILMDMQMPVMDGYDATRELRARGYDGQIVALTANALVGDEQICRTCGCDDYAAKPISPADLTAVVAAALERRDAAVDGPVRADDRRSHGGRDQSQLPEAQLAVV